MAIMESLILITTYDGYAIILKYDALLSPPNAPPTSYVFEL
jgi:hypothetical protein